MKKMMKIIGLALMIMSGQLLAAKSPSNESVFILKGTPHELSFKSSTITHPFWSTSIPDKHQLRIFIPVQSVPPGQQEQAEVNIQFTGKFCKDNRELISTQDTRSLEILADSNGKITDAKFGGISRIVFPSCDKQGPSNYVLIKVQKITSDEYNILPN